MHRRHTTLREKGRRQAIRALPTCSTERGSSLTAEEERSLMQRSTATFPLSARCWKSPKTLNFNCVDYMGKNALQLAVGNEHLEVTELLLKKDGLARVGDALLLGDQQRLRANRGGHFGSSGVRGWFKTDFESAGAGTEGWRLLCLWWGRDEVFAWRDASDSGRALSGVRDRTHPADEGRQDRATARLLLQVLRVHRETETRLVQSLQIAHECVQRAR